jgi:xanthine dehydrogenase accessory factor
MDSVDLEVLKRCAEWLDAGRRVLLAYGCPDVGACRGRRGDAAVRDDGLSRARYPEAASSDIVGRVRADGLAAVKCEVATYGVSADEARRSRLPCGGTIRPSWSC